MARQKAEAIRIRHYRVEYGGPLVAFCVGVVILFLAVPLLFSEVYLSRASRVLQDIRYQKIRTDQEELDKAIGYLDDATGWRPASRKLRVYKVMLLLALYERYPDRFRENKRGAVLLLKHVRKTLVSALEAGPGDSNSWYLLSEVEIRLNPKGRAAFEYLRMSYLTGGREGWIASRRLGFALVNWERLSQSGKQNALRDLSLLWNEKPYHKYLARIFLTSNPIGRAVIYRRIRQRGGGALGVFANSLRIEGWRGRGTLLQSVVGIKCIQSINCGEIE